MAIRTFQKDPSATRTHYYLISNSREHWTWSISIHFSSPKLPSPVALRVWAAEVLSQWSQTPAWPTWECVAASLATKTTLSKLIPWRPNTRNKRAVYGLENRSGCFTKRYGISKLEAKCSGPFCSDGGVICFLVGHHVSASSCAFVTIW